MVPKQRLMYLDTPSCCCNVLDQVGAKPSVVCTCWISTCSLQWGHNGRDSVSNHQPHDCFLNLLFRRRSKKTSSKLHTSLCARNSPVTGEFPTQMASNAENVSIWWRHHDLLLLWSMTRSCWFKSRYRHDNTHKTYTSMTIHVVPHWLSPYTELSLGMSPQYKYHPDSYSFKTQEREYNGRYGTLRNDIMMFSTLLSYLNIAHYNVFKIT